MKEKNHINLKQNCKHKTNEEEEIGRKRTRQENTIEILQKLTRNLPK